MNVQINQLVKTLLQKDTIEQCSLQELEQFASRHPYFGAAQLLLAKKLQEERSERYDEQLQKTFLFFHNPERKDSSTLADSKTGTAVVEKKEIPVFASFNSEIAEPPTGISTPGETGNAELAEEQQQQPPFPEIPAALPVEIKEPGDSIVEVNTTEGMNKPEEEPTPGTADEISVENNSFIDSATEADAEAGMEYPRQETAEEPALQLPDLKIEAIDPEKAELIFEPYHTVDYFASQGIKFKEEEKPADKFSQQLKSFTDWLKTMKRIPVREITGETAAKAGQPVAAEQKVEQLAEHSLTERQVVTEAMAEVWEKQGNGAKAIEIYNKLSLLDPSKSLYFAAKIEELKKIN